MLFVTYWEVNENMPVKERIQIAQELTSSGLFPPKGVNVIRWDGTPDLWGVIIAEAETAADMVRAVGMWRAAGAGFFKFTKTAPAMPIQELVPIEGELVQTLAST